MARLNQLAQLLVKTYDLGLAMDVEALLLRPEHLTGLAGARHDAVEQVFVYQEADHSPELGLYLAPWVQKTLTVHSPFIYLDQQNLAAVMYAIEGISHVTWLSWCLQHKTTVCQLELELQAEVDKFVLGYLLCGYHGSHSRPTMEKLAHLLFATAQLDGGLSAQEKERYIVASRAALRFVTSLLRPFGDPALTPNWLAQVRRFGRSAKMVGL